MSRDKHQKRLARERMAKTGECYRTALHQVQVAEHRGVAPDWHGQLRFMLLPKTMSRGEWEACAANPGSFPKSPVSVPLPQSDQHLAPDVVRELGEQQIAFLRQAAQAAGAASVEDIWSFLRRTAKDPPLLAKAKQRFLAFGVREAWRLLDEPRLALNLLMWGTDGHVDPNFRIVRCEHCAKHLGEVNVGLLFRPTEEDAEHSTAALENEMIAMQKAHIAKHAACNLANAIVTQEAGMDEVKRKGNPSTTPDDELRAVERRLAKAMEDFPDLNDFGMGLGDQDWTMPKEQHQARLLEQRRALLANVGQVAKTIAWLQDHVAPIKTINRHWTSYGLKHVVEKDTGYTSNGVLIAAALILGYPYKIERGNPNVEFGVSQKSLTKVREDRRAAARLGAW